MSVKICILRGEGTLCVGIIDDNRLGWVVVAVAVKIYIGREDSLRHTSVTLMMLGWNEKKQNLLWGGRGRGKF